MSQTFYLVCLEAKEWIWIGQGWDDMSVLYYGEHETMEKLKRFLNMFHDKELRFICSDTTNYIYDDGWKEFEEPEETRFGHPLEAQQFLTPEGAQERLEASLQQPLDASIA